MALLFFAVSGTVVLVVVCFHRPTTALDTRDIPLVCFDTELYRSIDTYLSEGRQQTRGRREARRTCREGARGSLSIICRVLV